MKKPTSRTALARTASNDPRRLSTVPPPASDRAALAAIADYEPYSKHKKRPDAYKLAAYQGPHEDPTYCDAHADFRPDDMPRAKPLLLRGIEAGLFGKTMKKGDPGLLWTVDDNGWIYEAQLTNPGYGVYHGYPVLPNEAIAKSVLARYADFIADKGDPLLDVSLRLARDRYR